MLKHILKFVCLTWTLLSAKNVLSQNEVQGEVFFESDACLGNVAVTKKKSVATRYFYTIHPESKPKGTKLFEIKDGKSVPYPSEEFQKKLKQPLGLYVDLQNRLWVLDHGFYARKKPKLLCFDLDKNELIFEHVFNQGKKKEVLKNTMLNDLAVAPDGHTVYISAPSLFKKHSSILVFDVSTKTTRRVLENHYSVTSKKIVPEVDGKKMKFFLGLYSVCPGVDGIDVAPDGKGIYYTAMSHDTLYKIEYSGGRLKLKSLFERPICDGIRVDQNSNIYLTDVENHQVLKYTPTGEMEVVFKNPEADWVDGLSIGNDGFLYITDSKLQHVMFKKPRSYKDKLPFKIWRVKI